MEAEGAVDAAEADRDVEAAAEAAAEGGRINNTYNHEVFTC
jgi:hypothetical protein